MDNPRLLYKQKVRFTIDVEVSISDYAKALLDADEVPKDYKEWAEQDPEEFVRDVGFQERLLHTMINVPDVIQYFVQDYAEFELTNYCEEVYQTYDPKQDHHEENLLASVVKTMDEDDKKLFADAVLNRYLSSLIQIATHDSFKAKVVSNTVEILDPDIKAFDLTN